MDYKLVIFAVLFFGLTSVGLAQSTRDATPAPKPPAPKYQVKKKEKKGFLFGLFKKKHRTDKDEVAEFREQVKERLRKRKREQEKANDPQYSNPFYFGHKKPPKKRKPGKKKFCKECGLVH